MARGSRRVALTDSLNALRLSAWFGGPSPQIVRATDAAIAAIPFRNMAMSDRPYDLAARVYALAGRPDKAREMLAERQHAVTDTAWNRQQQADVHRALAEIALAEHQPAIALDEFRKSDIGDDGYPERECGPCIAFNIARAFDAADQRDSAIVAYERYIAMPYYKKITDVDGEALAGTLKLASLSTSGR
jgi:hypothetical protein